MSDEADRSISNVWNYRNSLENIVEEANRTSDPGDYDRLLSQYRSEHENWRNSSDRLNSLKSELDSISHELQGTSQKLMDASNKTVQLTDHTEPYRNRAQDIRARIHDALGLGEPPGMPGRPKAQVESSRNDDTTGQAPLSGGVLGAFTPLFLGLNPVVSAVGGVIGYGIGKLYERSNSYNTFDLSEPSTSFSDSDNDYFGDGGPDFDNDHHSGYDPYNWTTQPEMDPEVASQLEGDYWSGVNSGYGSSDTGGGYDIDYSYSFDGGDYGDCDWEGFDGSDYGGNQAHG